MITKLLQVWLHWVTHTSQQELTNKACMTKCAPLRPVQIWLPNLNSVLIFSMPKCYFYSYSVIIND